MMSATLYVLSGVNFAFLIANVAFDNTIPACFSAFAAGACFFTALQIQVFKK